MTITTTILGVIFHSFGKIFQGTMPWQPILWKKGKVPLFVAVAFWNRMGYRYLNVRINNVNDASISCKNFVNFRPVLQSWQSSFVNFWYDMTRKTGVFSQTSLVILDRFMQSFHCMKAFWVQIIDMNLIFRFVKGRCHGNQIMLKEVMNADYLHSLH